MNETLIGERRATPLRGKRILVAKPGLDGHDIGAKVVALALRDAGAEVIYTGLRRSPEFIARVAVDEGVDAIGLSVLSGSHCELAQQVANELKRQGAEDIALFVGGTIPADDEPRLRELGVRAVFTNDMTLDDAIDTVARELK